MPTLRPWSRRSWIFPRDPEFGPKAERVLDLYHRQWNGRALFGDVVAKISMVAFDALVAQVMAREPYRSARRIFWIVDGGTIHRGQRAADRLQARFDNLTLVHLPTHASWMNQIEIYFSILQRKALTPAHPSLREAA